MEQNKNDQERTKYTLLIAEKERAVEDISRDQQKLEESLSFLQEDLQRGYRELSAVNEDYLMNENLELIRLQRKNEEQEHYFKRQLENAEELIAETYSEQRKTLDDETEELYKKRGEIPWD